MGARERERYLTRCQCGNAGTAYWSEKQLDELGISQFVLDSRAAIAAELGRREKALDKAEAPDPRRISIMLRGQADLRGL